MCRKGAKGPTAKSPAHTSSYDDRSENDLRRRLTPLFHPPHYYVLQLLSPHVSNYLIQSQKSASTYDSDMSTQESPMKESKVDVLIIGAGPAGGDSAVAFLWSPDAS